MTYAYVFLVFGGDNYVIGAMVTAYSLIKTKTKHDIVCMVTNDVSQQSIIEMKKLNIKVIKVPYLKYNTKPLLTKRQNELYNKWSNVSYTKWNCLALTQYKKVLFMDVDMIVVKNIDNIFKQKCPMGVFENSYDELYIKRGIKNYYRKSIKESVFGEIIHPNSIKKALYNKGFVATGTCMLLKPSKKMYSGFIKMMTDLKEPFGFNCYSSADEQCIAYYMSVYDKGPKLKWKNMTNSYAAMLWHYLTKTSMRDIDIKIIDFMGELKPWLQPRNAFKDLEFWYSMASDMFKKNKNLIIPPMKYIKDIY